MLRERPFDIYGKWEGGQKNGRKKFASNKKDVSDHCFIKSHIKMVIFEKKRNFRKKGLLRG